MTKDTEELDIFLTGNMQLHCPDIGINADDCVVVLVSVIKCGASVAAYVGDTSRPIGM